MYWLRFREPQERDILVLFICMTRLADCCSPCTIGENRVTDQVSPTIYWLFCLYNPHPTNGEALGNIITITNF